MVLHDLRTQKVDYIANNLSKREIGDDSSLEDMLSEDVSERNIGPYEKAELGRTEDSQPQQRTARRRRSSAGGAVHQPEYFAVRECQGRAGSVPVAEQVDPPQPDSLFRDDWQERINTFLHAWMRERQLSLNLLTRDHKRELVLALHAEGAFKGKSASNYVANVLNMGRATVYKHLKELKG
nr:transcriptional regulator DauR [Pseudomonas brassicacearum subsp. brassicacearum]